MKKERDPIQISVEITRSLRKFYREFTVGLGWLAIWSISNIANRKWRSFDEFVRERGYHKIDRWTYEKL